MNMFKDGLPPCPKKFKGKKKKQRNQQEIILGPVYLQNNFSLNILGLFICTKCSKNNY